MFEEWFEAAKGLLNIYKNLAKLKMEGKENTDEYNLLLSLLEDASKAEKGKIDKIKFDTNTKINIYNSISSHIKNNGDLDNCDLLTKNDAIVCARIFNITEALDFIPIISQELSSSNDSLADSIAALMLREKQKAVRFDHFFQTYVSFNFIYIINLAIDNTDDKNIKDYLIKLLFSSIYINPTYENYFKKANAIFKPINISEYLNEVVDKDYKKEEVMQEILYNLIDISIEELEAELNKKDEDLNDSLNCYIHIKNLSHVFGKLISLMDESIVNKVEEKIKDIISQKETDANERIVNDVLKMFEYAKVIISKYNNKKERKYGKISKETN